MKLNFTDGFPNWLLLACDICGTRGKWIWAFKIFYALPHAQYLVSQKIRKILNQFSMLPDLSLTDFWDWNQCNKGYTAKRCERWPAWQSFPIKTYNENNDNKYINNKKDGEKCWINIFNIIVLGIQKLGWRGTKTLLGGPKSWQFCAESTVDLNFQNCRQSILWQSTLFTATFQ